MRLKFGENLKMTLNYRVKITKNKYRIYLNRRFDHLLICLI